MLVLKILNGRGAPYYNTIIVVQLIYCYARHFDKTEYLPEKKVKLQ